MRTLRKITTVLLLTTQGLAWAGWDEAVAAYERGDYETALREFHILAAQGDKEAQFNLGIMYDMGQGIPQDYVQAHKWYNLAGANGHETARKKRDILAKQMHPAQIAEAQKLAREWVELRQ